MSLSWDAIEEQTQDLYQILGTSRNASLKDIKRAYKNKARQLHPDRNLDDPENAKLRFQEVVKAYEILKDDTKRQIYDEYGENGLKECGIKLDLNNLDDLFTDVFGDDNNKENDNQETVLAKVTIPNVTLSNLYTGITKYIDYTYEYQCKDCYGKGEICYEETKSCDCNNGRIKKYGNITKKCQECCGNKYVYAPLHCIKCQGTGQVTGWINNSKSCAECNGTGKISDFQCTDCKGSGSRSKGFRQGNEECRRCSGNGRVTYCKCSNCNGSGTVREKGEYEISCNKCDGNGNIYYNKKIKCKNCRGIGNLYGSAKRVRCDVVAGTDPDDIIKIKHIDHENSIYGVVLVSIDYVTNSNDEQVFIRSSNNLITITNISLRQALLGGDIVIHHLDGTQLFINYNYNILQMNDTKKINGKGMPIKGIRNGFGDLFIKFKIELPKILSQYNIKQICNYLPQDTASVDDNQRVERVLLADLNGFDEMELRGIQSQKGNKNCNDATEENVDCKQM